MAKFYVPIGCAIPFESRPGVWKDRIEERAYYGELLGYSSRSTTSQDSTNDELNITSKFSIVADPFAHNNCHAMKYIRYMGTNWKITNIEPQYPRLILTVGGVYNGPTKS